MAWRPAERSMQLNQAGARDGHVRPATRADAPGIVWVSNSSILPDEDVGFGGRMDSSFHDTSALLSAWRDPNLVQGEEVLVAEMDGRIVGCVTVEDTGRELELVNIDAPLGLQGIGFGTVLVRSVEERARGAGKQAGSLGTRRNAEGVAWQPRPLLQHLGDQL